MWKFTKTNKKSNCFHVHLPLGIKKCIVKPIFYSLNPDPHWSRCGSSIRIRITLQSMQIHSTVYKALQRLGDGSGFESVASSRGQGGSVRNVETTKKKSWAREIWSFPWGYEKNHCLSWWSSFPPHKLVKILADIKYGNLFKNFQYLHIFSITRKIENSEDYVSQNLVICTAEVGTFASLSFIIITTVDSAKVGTFASFSFHIITKARRGCLKRVHSDSMIRRKIACSPLM